MELQGKTAIITGVSRGIGLETCKVLLEKGVRVAGWGRRPPAFNHPTFRFFQADVRDYNSIQNAWSGTVDAFGPDIHILVNNAGVGYSGPLEDLDLGKWNEMMATNVAGVFHCCKLLIPRLKAAGAGHIVNVSSTAGKTGRERLAAYCATKFAVRGLSEALASELRPFGVKVTCLMPGAVRTAFFDNLGKSFMSAVPLEPRDVAQAIVNVLESGDNSLTSELELRPLRQAAPGSRVKNILGRILNLSRGK